jgi:uncharacterized protein (TIGR00299 family) protein
MCLGALVSLGVPLGYLEEKLEGLGIAQEYSLSAQQVWRQSQQATKVDVALLPQDNHENDHNHHGHHHGRYLSEIESMILQANLPSSVETWSLAIFRQLALAEGAVHGIEPDQVHFHEVGAVDAIVDIVGTCLGLDWLGVDHDPLGFPLVYCSAFPSGGGTVRADHGQMSVPVPAVLKLWEMRGCPVYSNGIEKELVTPTGAAIATTLARDFGSLPHQMLIEQIGYGAGSLELPIPNILRLWLGEGQANHFEAEFDSQSVETISVLKTQIDDLSPQAISYVFDALFTVGALDVFTQAIGMKKSRPGILLTVICHPENLASCEAVLFRETTTLGIRHTTERRTILHREIQPVEIKYGQVNVKVAWKQLGSEKVVTNVQPEYEDCAFLARKHDVPWREIQRLGLQAWYDDKGNRELSNRE